MVDEYRRCAASYEYFIENYIQIDDNSGSLKLIQLYDYQKKLLKLINGSRFTICKFPRQPFALDTALLTTTGWTTIGEVKRGDFVYGRDGNPVKVIGISPIMEHNKCFEIVFSFDGGTETIVTDEHHRWFVMHSGHDEERVLSTIDIFESDYSNLYIRAKDKVFKIFSIREVESVPVKCIEVENHDHSFLIGENKIPTSNCGKTTSMATYIVWCIIFRKRFKVGVAADKDETALEIVERIKTAYENLPYWLQQGVKKWDAHKIVLENGSRVESSATTKKTMRGKTFNLVLLDEFAFVDQNIADPFFTSIYPVLSKDDPTVPFEKKPKMVIISTPNGMNHFHKLYVEAEEKRSSFKSIEIKWNDVPGRDEKFKEETLRNIGEDRWEQEYDGQFLGTPTSLIPASKLKTLTWRDPREHYDDMKFWKSPQLGHTYFITVDVCRGRGLDYHAMSIVDITKFPYEVVATYHNNTLDTMMLPSLVLEMAKRYHDAFVLIELNDIGEQVSNILAYELEYENVLATKSMGRSGQVLSIEAGKTMGVTMTKSVKSTGCSNLKSLIMNDKLRFYDYTYISELTTFEIKSGQYKAAEGAHDDMVMTLVSFAWATTEVYFSDLMDTNLRLNLFERKIAQMEEDLVPVGFFPNDDPDDDGLIF